MAFDFNFYKEAADYIKARINFEPDIAIILGTGLGGFGSRIENPIVLDYKDIPNFLLSTVDSHSGKLICGQLEGKNIVCMSGRFHYYEGYSYEQLALPVRVLKLLNVKSLIITNAVGAVNRQYKPGDVMIISDHINLAGACPTRGPNVDEFGERFFDTGEMYSKPLRWIAKDAALDSELTVHEGVYQFFVGPQFETPAEIRAARMLGADVVGMSTVWEALTAAHCKLPLLGISLVTNMAAGVADVPLSSEEVGACAQRVAAPFQKFIIDVIARMTKF